MRGEYSTRQKRELLKFLKEHELENFSVDEVVLRLRERGASVGRSTAYRYLEALAEQGKTYAEILAWYYPGTTLEKVS